jgi:hypothetical protein
MFFQLSASGPFCACRLCYWTELKTILYLLCQLTHLSFQGSVDSSMSTQQTWEILSLSSDCYSCIICFHTLTSMRKYQTSVFNALHNRQWDSKLCTLPRDLWTCDICCLSQELEERAQSRTFFSLISVKSPHRILSPLISQSQQVGSRDEDFLGNFLWKFAYNDLETPVSSSYIGWNFNFNT